MAKFVVHAAKIPEGIRDRDRDTRMLAGDMVYVNSCDDKPWSRPLEGLSMLDGVACPACLYIVEANRTAKASRG